MENNELFEEVFDEIFDEVFDTEFDVNLEMDEIDPWMIIASEAGNSTVA